MLEPHPPGMGAAPLNPVETGSVFDPALSLPRRENFREEMGNGLRVWVTQNEDHNHEGDRK
jgi:hypothetical protein